MIDWMPELERRYGRQKAKDLTLLMVVINRYYRRDLDRVEADGASQSRIAKRAMMSRGYVAKLVDILENELRFVVQHKPRISLKGGRPPKIFKPAYPFPEAPKRGVLSP